VRTCLKKHFTKEEKMAQGEGSEFKNQYHKKKKERKKCHR
jgi:hypothetical protein